MNLKTIACLFLAISSCASSAGAQAPDPRRAVVAPTALSVDDCFKGAEDYENQKQYKQAEELYNRVVTNIEKEKNKNLPALFKAYNGMGNVDLKSQDLQGADLNYREALAVAVKLYGAGSYDLVKPLMSIARICYQEKKYLDSATYLKQALALAERKAGLEGAESVGIREKLAETYERSGNYKESETLIKQSLQLREKSGDHNSAQLLALLNCYSDVLHKTDRQAEAEQIDYQVDQIHAGKIPAAIGTSNQKP